MKARLLHHDKYVFDDGSLYEIKIWQVPAPVPPTTHGLKYSMAYIRDGARIAGYDNERGKGDHRHFHGTETPYIFVSIEKLLSDFRSDIERLRGGPI